MEIDTMRHKTAITGVLLLISLVISGAVTVGAVPFSERGQLIQGPNCLLFVRGNPAQDELVLENYGYFGPGTSVHVSGDLVMGCQTSCSLAVGCVLGNSIDSSSTPPQPFFACGVLVQQDACLLFAPDSFPSTKYRLEHYGGFHVGDRVCVSGDFVAGCMSSCPGVLYCIQNNSISPAYPQGSYFVECGVLNISTACKFFLPGGNPFAKVVLDSVGGYHNGDTVRICGVFTPSCQTTCSDTLGCVAVDSIWLCNAPPTNRVLGKAIVRLGPDQPISPIIVPAGATLVDSIRRQHTYLVQYPDSISTEAFIDSMLSHPEVVYAEPSYELNLPEVLQMSISFPDDAAHPYVVDVSPTEYFNQPAASILGIDSANARTGGAGILVAVIDNGVDYAQPALTGTLVNGYDFFDNDPDPSDIPGEAFGHGTFACGMIRLVAPNCQILPLRAFGPDGVGNSFAITQAIYFAIDHGADVINMSFGVYESSAALEKACSTAVAAGITLVAAAGSDSTFMPIYPAALPGVIAVTALDTSGAICYMSNYGDYIDVCAPGVNLYSALAGIYDWGNWSGTSFSAALVTGSCALIRSLNRTLTGTEIESQIQTSANKTIHGITISPPDQYYGYGRLDAATAVWTTTAVDTTLVGDINGSGEIDVSDAVYLCDYIFNSGPRPVTQNIADVNCDAAVDVSDAVALLNFIFGSGASPGCR
jgi:thermitase